MSSLDDLRARLRAGLVVAEAPEPPSRPPLSPPARTGVDAYEVTLSESMIRVLPALVLEPGGLSVVGGQLEINSKCLCGTRSALSDLLRQFEKIARPTPRVLRTPQSSVRERIAKVAAARIRAALSLPLT